MFEEAVRARALWCAAMGAVLLATPSFAGTLPPDDSFSMLQEQLTVTAANRRPQPVSETPSAVSVITAAEIRAHGYHTLGEALSWVRGLYTRYDRNYTYLGVRGLQRPGDYNNKVLLTIDGHTMNSPIYGDAAFGGELGLDLERVERIEVVRGPGSTLYGSNAVLAVVTYAPRATPGIEADVRTGQEGDHRGYLALSSARGDRPHLALSASWDRSRGADLFYPEFASTPGSNGLVRRADGERSMGMLGLLTWRDTWLSVKVNERLKNVPTASFGTAFGDPGTRTSDGHDFAEWGARTSPARTLEMESRIYWDASR
jgi:iron complex outermembrane receptor protein